MGACTLKFTIQFITFLSLFTDLNTLFNIILLITSTHTSLTIYYSTYHIITSSLSSDISITFHASKFPLFISSYSRNFSLIQTPSHFHYSSHLFEHLNGPAAYFNSLFFLFSQLGQLINKQKKDTLRQLASSLPTPGGRTN